MNMKYVPEIKVFHLGQHLNYYEALWEKVKCDNMACSPLNIFSSHCKQMIRGITIQN